ncbi:hypothetical protein D3C87_1210920 [compost metagenome]
MLAVAQQVIHQQLFNEGFNRLRQLGEEHPEVFQDLLPGQRLARCLAADTCAIDQVQATALAQQIVQVQVFLPQALAMHLTDRTQRLGQHRALPIGQYGLLFNLLPGVAQAFGMLKEIKQQPATLAILQTISQQLRRGQPLSREQAHAVQLTLKMPCGLAANEQFGQHRPATPDAGTDITLPRQHPQQAQQLQLGGAGGVGQRNVQRQAWGAAGRLQFG